MKFLLCTENQARAAVYILTHNTRVCIREYCCVWARPGNDAGAGNDASARKSVVLVFHNGGLKAALNAKV